MVRGDRGIFETVVLISLFIFTAVLCLFKPSWTEPSLSVAAVSRGNFLWSF